MAHVCNKHTGFKDHAEFTQCAHESFENEEYDWIGPGEQNYFLLEYRLKYIFISVCMYVYVCVCMCVHVYVYGCVC